MKRIKIFKKEFYILSKEEELKLEKSIQKATVCNYKISEMLEYVGRFCKFLGMTWYGTKETNDAYKGSEEALKEAWTVIKFR